MKKINIIPEYPEFWCSVEDFKRMEKCILEENEMTVDNKGRVYNEGGMYIADIDMKNMFNYLIGIEMTLSELSCYFVDEGWSDPYDSLDEEKMLKEGSFVTFTEKYSEKESGEFKSLDVQFDVIKNNIVVLTGTCEL